MIHREWRTGRIWLRLTGCLVLLVVTAQALPCHANPDQDDSPVNPAAAEGQVAPDTTETPQLRPFDRPAAAPAQTPILEERGLMKTPIDPPLGFTGRSGILPSEGQSSDHFVPAEDRWRIGFPYWDRYDKGHPPIDSYPYVEGHWWDPHNLNVLKGDYPIIGQHTFLNISASTLIDFETQQIPTATTPFESTKRPNERDFFGNPNRFLYTNYFRLDFDLFHGDAAFKPVDWRIKVSPVFNVNDFEVEEFAIVNPDVRKGSTRARTFLALEEYFLEAKIADVSPDYDFVSARVGSQFFTSDFRGFIFSDTNRGARLFGTYEANRDQFNLVVFDMTEKDTNSQLNTFRDRHQLVVIANYYRQDFIWPGYTAQVSVHYNHDQPSFLFDKNNFLVRPAGVGTFQPHQIDAVYFGWTGDGHIGRINVTHAFYWVVGRDSNNPFANQEQDINAQMAAVELSYDRDWVRFRTSFLYASGDGDINNRHATGFDSIQDNPNFAGGEFSYFQRQAIPLLGVNLVNRESLLPDLRTSKFQGQSNFVNPGLFLVNAGIDFELTPKLRMINNANLLWFDKTDVLQQFVFQKHVGNYIGLDLSAGFEYRPLLNNNVIMTAGVSGLIPGDGFKDLYNKVNTDVPPLFACFVELNLNY
jgi:hypothetical protein